MMKLKGVMLGEGGSEDAGRARSWPGRGRLCLKIYVLKIYSYSISNPNTKQNLALVLV